MAHAQPPIGIETTRPVKSIHRIAEHRLNRKRLLDLRDRSEGDREGERLFAAECDLREAIRRYLKRCPSPEILRRLVEKELEKQ